MGRGGVSLTGILIIVGILYFSGAGTWLWQRMQTLDSSCYALMERAGVSQGGSVCSAVGNAVKTAGEGMHNLGESIMEMVANFSAHLPAGLGGLHFQSFADSLMNQLGNGDSSLNQWASPMSRLQQLMNNGPESIGTGASPSQRIRTALDNFMVGQRYLQADDGNAALHWLGQGAQQSGYGVLSQLALGNLYQHGGGGVTADPVMAARYYQQAQNSITTLNGSQAPEAQQLLQSLPASPRVMQAQLNVVIGQLRQSVVHR